MFFVNVTASDSNAEDDSDSEPLIKKAKGRTRRPKKKTSSVTPRKSAGRKRKGEFVFST